MNEIRVALCHPTANANSRQAALALAEADLLQAFHTSLAVFPGTLLGALSKFRIFSDLRRRELDGRLRGLTRCSPWPEIGRLLAGKLGPRWREPKRMNWISVDAIYRSLDRRVSADLQRGDEGGLSAIYAYEDGAKNSFRRAKNLGITRLYELPIGYWRAGHKIFREEAARQPEWAGTMPGLLDSDLKLQDKDEELRTAQQIFVASEFTRSTLKECPFSLAPITMISYGCPAPASDEPAKRPLGRNLRVLFVGGLGQRKGLSYLLEAVDKLKGAVDLTLIGTPEGTSAQLKAALKKWRWLSSIPQIDVLREMRSHDVLVFPSLFEGFGLVITEALSQGTPVITTTHTAGPDILTEGVDGFVVPIRDAEAIASRLDRLQRDRGLLLEMKHAAKKKAEQWSWAHYREAFARDVKSAIQTHGAR